MSTHFRNRRPTYRPIPSFPHFLHANGPSYPSQSSSPTRSQPRAASTATTPHRQHPAKSVPTDPSEGCFPHLPHMSEPAVTPYHTFGLNPFAPHPRPTRDSNNSSASPRGDCSALHGSAGADAIFRPPLHSSERFTPSASKHTHPSSGRPHAPEPHRLPRLSAAFPRPPSFVGSAARCRRLPRLRVPRTLQPNGKEKGASESGKGLRAAARRYGG